MASTDARPIPIKNVAYRVTFPIWDADGDLVTGATGLDSEVSKDGGTFADCTSEATEIATASGMYFLDLTNTEMNADTVAIIVKTSSSGAKTTPIVLYPNEAGDIDVDVTVWNGTAVATPDTAGYPKVTIKDGTGTGEIDMTSGGVLVAAYASGQAPLQPTVAGRTLDVTAAGEAGIDWANIGSPATAVNLSATNIDVDQVVASVSGAVGSVTAGVTVTTNNDKTGYGLSAAAVQAIWDALTSALTTVGSIGKRLVDNIDAAISTRLATAGYTTPPTVLAIADQVWDETLAGHLAAGSTGDALNAAGAAGDPWSTALPGAYGAGTAGKIVGDNINATIGSRSTVTTAQVNAEVVDALATDTYAEPGSVPAATSSIKDKLNWLFLLARNKRTTTSTADTVRNDADSGTVATSTISDDGTTFSRGEYT